MGMCLTLPAAGGTPGIPILDMGPALVMYVAVVAHGATPVMPSGGGPPAPPGQRNVSRG